MAHICATATMIRCGSRHMRASSRASAHAGLPVRVLQASIGNGASSRAARVAAAHCSFAQQPRHFSSYVDDHTNESADLATTSLATQMEDAATVVLKDSDLASVMGGAEPVGGSSIAVVQAVQSMIEQVHATTGLPWWATLAATGVFFRASVFPFYVFQIKAAQRLVQAKTDFAKVFSAYRFARTFAPKGTFDDHLKAMMLGKKGYELVLKKYDTRPVQTVLGSLVHIPIFILVAYSARDMIRSGNFDGLETGGLWLWSNLKDTDSTYMLPLLASGSVFMNLEVSRRTRSAFWSNILQYMQFAPILAFPVIATLPQGVFFYWIASSWSSLGQTLLMQNNGFRRRIGLPPRGSLATAPKSLAASATSNSSSHAKLVTASKKSLPRVS